MTQQTGQQGSRACQHAVEFYGHDSELVASVGPQLRDAFDDGGVAVVIATPEHRFAFERELDRLGVRPHGRLRLLDASITLDRLMPDGRIDPESFRHVIGSLIRDAAPSAGTVWVYGDMVALLWADGDLFGALELEQLWNELQETVEFSLLCAYPSAIASDPRQAGPVDEMCRVHTMVSRAGPPARPTVVLNGFEPSLDAPRRARAFVGEVLRDHGDFGLVSDASLIVSELATNAVVHAGTRFEVAVHFKPGTVTLSVTDSSAGRPATGDPSPLDPHGRGLIVVDALALDWGCSTTTRAGKSVWAELAR
jgi:hypothetical protein